MSTPKAIRTALITLAVIAIAAVFIALACAPAAPSSQRENPTPKPTKAPTQRPTNTPETVIIYQNNTPIPIRLDPEPLTEPILKGSLQDDMEDFEATKEAHEHSGRSAETLEDPFIGINIEVHTTENVDQLSDWLTDRQAYIVEEDRSPEHGIGIIAHIRMSHLKDLSELEWVKWAKAMEQPSLDQNPPQPSSSIIDLKEAQGITAWRDAGITGDGVEVGIIDRGFEKFSTNIAQTPSALGFRPRAEPTNIPSDCESFTDHGTKVAEQLLNVAPGIKIYISNPSRPTARSYHQTYHAISAGTPHGDQRNRKYEYRRVNLLITNTQRTQFVARFPT